MARLQLRAGLMRVHDGDPAPKKGQREEKPLFASSNPRDRILFTMVVFALAYVLIAGRLVVLGFTTDAPTIARLTAADSVSAARPDLVDRNGEILATDIRTASLYAEPRRILDVDEAIELLSSVMPSLNTPQTRNYLASDAGFVWLKREITPDQKRRIHNLGLPGIGFVDENRRFYPGGPTASHFLGHVNIDNEGIAGMEKFVDGEGLADLQAFGFANKERSLEPVPLSLDLRVQHVVRDELTKAMDRYKAVAAVGIVLDVHTGEVLGMSSLPDYDPNDPALALQPDRLNRATAGVFEMGSVFKSFNTAMALDTDRISIDDSFDASKPLRVRGNTITDFHGKHRVLTVPEIFIYSSNIGSAKMAQAVGVPGQKAFFSKIGMTDKLPGQLPEMARPMLPPKWDELTSMTIAFGHGIGVTPMHTAVAAAALMNGGKLIPPSFVPRSREEADGLAKQVVSPKTSDQMRYLFRLNCERGSGRRAEVPGYRVGGKTGTAEKIVNGRYVGNKRFNSFLSAFPIDDPQYVVLIVIDEPKPEEGQYSATAGLNAAPTVAAVIRRIAPMLGVTPRFDMDSNALLVSY
ncbi:cell division protein FtsI (penicillin-binding protein 3) [Rhodobium orientis]|nr:cell division protein FtsI (penicillin-binding protein 3) [Rhodobium orientis]